MEVTTKIRRPLADEHVIGTDPPLRPELADVWRRRINPFAGRAISDKALTAEQDVRSGMQRVVGLAMAPGSVEGLEILLDAGAIGSPPESALFQVAPGLGITQSGEDVGIGALRQLSFGMLPVILRTDHADALEGEGIPDPERLPPVMRPPAEPEDETGGMAVRLRPVRPRRLGQTLAQIAANPESANIPHIGVLVAQPVAATILGRPVDDCPPDPRDDAYADLQRIDGCRLAFYLWPDEAVAIDGGPDYALPVTTAALRNRLAYGVFDNEKLFETGEMHPWEEWGVPLALAVFDGDWRLSFIDRFAVARIGGTPRARSAMVPMSGDVRLFQARIDQFVNHLADLPRIDEETLREAFVRMPPVGLLPPESYDPVLRRQHFFPGNYGVSAVPVPRSNLELAISEAASLASFNRGIPDRVELLVPVPDHVYDPGLLEVAMEDPRFTEAITAFREDRATWLSRREGARRRYDRLMESVSGLVTGWALADLPMEENSPAPRTQVPIEISRTRRFNEQSAARTHVMVGAHATLPIAKSDTVWVWLRIHSDTQMTGLSLRLGTGTGSDPAGPFAAGVYWGQPAAMPIASEPDGLEARRQGDLPEVGVWHRLEVPASAVWTSGGGNLDTFSVNGIEFTQRGGEVEWGSFGKTDVNGLNYSYIGDDAPAGATLVTSGQEATGWPWQDVEGRAGLDVPEFGTVRTGDVRRVGAVDGFRNTWTQDFLAADMAKLDEGGLSTFLAEVEGRLKATNDAVDLGFVRARSDIYRVRQIMLGADSASRLVTSPSLADLASRDEGARATSRGIADFLANVGVTRPPGSQQPPPITAAQAQATTQPQQPLMLMSTAFSPSVMTLNTATTFEAARVTRFSAASFATLAAGPSAPVTAPITAAVSTPAVAAAATTPLFAGPSTFVTTGLAATFQPAMSLTAARFAMDEVRYRPRDIQLQLPVAGLVERTASVAERLTVPPAVQALNYAIATKAALVATLSGLQSSNNDRPNGIHLDDIPMPGFGRKRPAGSVPAVDENDVPNLAQLLADRAAGSPLFDDADKLPQAGDKHESDYFTAAVKAIDNSIAIMRLVEGRIALFEQLAQHIRDLRQEILDLANQAAAYLRAVDVEVEEARHDLTMAQQLRAEERARIDATNARRANVLATHVQAIAWRRVRECDHRTLAPTLEISSALAEDPVIACRREHEDVADEIEDYVDLLRDAPVRWFPRLAREVDRIQRLEAARAAIEAMRYRAMMPLRFFAPPPTAPKFLRGVHNALLTQRRLVEERRVTIQQMNLSLLHTLSLAQSQVQIRQMATIGDLLDNRHRQPALTRMASEEIDGIETVAGCLHESFGEVAPILRLRWAEDLSEFDRPAPLHSLAGLPGWPEVPLELRRTLQGFVDWLFRRIDRNDKEATDAINELIRICLLMASHAPVDRLIPAQLVEPAPARIGGRIQLALDITRVRRGMIALIRDRNDQIVSRAVIEDLIDGHASAVITQNLQAVTTISTDMRFQLMSGKA